MPNNEKNVEALLQRSSKELRQVRIEYEKSLSTKTVTEDLKIDIKNLCGNLRSILDYLAHDIRDKHCVPNAGNSRFYFPILSDHSSFIGQMNSWFPGLRSNAPDLWNYLESVQPYHPGNEWLSNFNKVNNENKHQQLVPQTTTVTERVQVNTQGGGQVSWNPGSVTFGSGVFIGGVPVNPTTQMPVPSKTQKVERITWVDFRFSDPDTSVLPLLEACYKGIEDIAQTVRQWL